MVPSLPLGQRLLSYLSAKISNAVRCIMLLHAMIERSGGRKMHVGNSYETQLGCNMQNLHFTMGIFVNESR